MGRFDWIVSALVVFAFIAPPSPAQQAQQAQETPRSWLDDIPGHEQRLLSAEVVEIEEVGEGVTNPRKVTLRDGDTTFYAVYKPLKRGRHKGYWESYQAEVAAYQLDRLLSLDMVPPTVIRRINGNLGSLQLWVEGCDTYKRLQKKVRLTPGFSRQVSRMKMFDNLIFNDDRNAGNFLLDASTNIVLIDHSRAFIERRHLLKSDSKLPAQYDRKLVERLKSLSVEQLEPVMGELLMGGQLESILKRRDSILEHLELLIEENGEARVLFD